MKIKHIPLAFAAFVTGCGTSATFSDLEVSDDNEAPSFIQLRSGGTPTLGYYEGGDFGSSVIIPQIIHFDDVDGVAVFQQDMVLGKTRDLECSLLIRTAATRFIDPEFELDAYPSLADANVPPECVPFIPQIIEIEEPPIPTEMPPPIPPAYEIPCLDPEFEKVLRTPGGAPIEDSRRIRSECLRGDTKGVISPRIIPTSENLNSGECQGEIQKRLIEALNGRESISFEDIVNRLNELKKPECKKAYERAIDEISDEFIIIGSIENIGQCSSGNFAKFVPNLPYKLWTPGDEGNVVITYFIDIDAPEIKEQIKDALDMWEIKSQLRFKPADKGEPQIIFRLTQSGSEKELCSAPVGRQVNKEGDFTQSEVVVGGCIISGYDKDTVGLIAHEIGHVLGLWHEHARADRDDYVEILYPPNEKSNYQRVLHYCPGKYQ
ncbi:MAG: M12 family metallopeptidase, partial [Pseudomonadota bacterium]